MRQTGIAKRLCAFVLVFVFVLGLLPGLPKTTAQAAGWSQPYIDQLVEWNVMRGDQEGGTAPDRYITRAEFAAMINRAFGYEKLGTAKFSDVPESAWYADDISIAAQAGYMVGTGSGKASPDDTLTREEATVLLCRNLMLEEEVGENLNFVDSRTISSWSRGMIKAASNEGIISGDTEGTFRPQAPITRGEVSKMLVSVIGTLIQQPGTYNTSTWGNVMVNTSGVTLQNMTITGDLYITAGVGLGYVTLDNVQVLGSIILSGTGQSNAGNHSVILRNVTAKELLVDSPANQPISVGAQGSTRIENTYIRTNTFLEDTCYGDNGFLNIFVDGEEGTRLELSGDFGNVTARTPRSAINVGKGYVDRITIDESAPNSTVNIAEYAVVGEMNLDVGTIVTGDGDIEHLNVNANGSNVSMLPDQIVIRPGYSAIIGGEVMDSIKAEQSSEDPRLLSGYPKASDVAPQQVETVYKTNKEGTIYWAINESGDGKAKADDLIKPPTYGSKFIKNGALEPEKAYLDVSQMINGLTVDTEYLVSAVLVDSRGQKSKVKTVKFSTPDNSVPNFASGYPKMSKIEDTYAEVAVMMTKTCKLHWALYPTGAPAPTENDFKSSNFPGALANGSLDMTRAVEQVFPTGNVLEELKTYDIYFWAIDNDGIQKSAIKKLTFTTADRTPPKFNDTYPQVGEVQQKNIQIITNMDEDCTVYWVAVKIGTPYPVTDKYPNGDAPFDDLESRMQIKLGRNAQKKGSFNAKKDQDAKTNITGLEEETSYDIYMVAEDKAGNLSLYTKITGKTLDSKPPTASMDFSDMTSSEPPAPMASTDVMVVFNEQVSDANTNRPLDELYKARNNSAEDKQKWLDAIQKNFTLTNLSNQPTTIISFTDDYVMNHVTAVIGENGNTVVTFQNDNDDGNGVLQLYSGDIFQFTLNNIRDTSNNKMGQNYKIDPFTIAFAQVYLADTSDGTPASNGQPIDMSFTMTPEEGTTAKVNDRIKYDVIFWSDTSVKFKLYYRENGQWKPVPKKGAPTEAAEGSISKKPEDKEWTGVGLNGILELEQIEYPQVNQLETVEYGIQLTAVEGNTDSTAWDKTIQMRISYVAGQSSALNVFRGTIPWKAYEDALKEPNIAQRINAIGTPDPFIMRAIKSNTAAPKFINSLPTVSAGDSVANIGVQLDRKGTVHYALAPYYKSDYASPMLPSVTNGPIEGANGESFTGQLTPNDTDPNIDNSIEKNIPEMKSTIEQNYQEIYDYLEKINITTPNQDQIINEIFKQNPDIKTGNLDFEEGAVQNIRVEGLKPETDYLAYFVLKGSAIEPSYVYCYRFRTSTVEEPDLILTNGGNGTVGFQVKSPSSEPLTAQVDYVIYSSSSVPPIFDTPFTPVTGGPDKKIINAMLDKSFNREAPQHIKIQVADTVRNAATSGQAVHQAGRLNPDLPTTEGIRIVDASEGMIEDTFYTCFAVAHNVLDETGDVFAAIGGIQVPNIDAPKISSISTSVSATSEGYTGSVSISFNKPIYQYVTQDIDDYPYYEEHPIVSSEKRKAPNQVTFESLLSGSLKDNVQVTSGNGDNKALSTVTLKVTKAAPNGDLIIGAKLSDGKNHARTDNSISLQLRELITTEGKKVAHFVLSDGTVSETTPGQLPPVT